VSLTRQCHFESFTGHATTQGEDILRDLAGGRLP